MKPRLLLSTVRNRITDHKTPKTETPSPELPESENEEEQESPRIIVSTPEHEIMSHVDQDEKLDEAFQQLKHFHFESDDEETDEYGAQAFRDKCESFDHFMFPVEPIVEKLNLKELNISHAGLGDKGMIALGECLKVNRTVESLILKDNFITPVGFKALVESLVVNRSIKRLDLCENQLGTRKVDERFGEVVTWFLNHNGSTHDLVLKSNKLMDGDIRDLCQAMCEDQHIRSLDLSFNDISPASADFIYEMLDNNTHLKVLNLEWNGLQNEGSFRVLEGIQRNNVLEHVNLSWCGVTDLGAEVVASIITLTTALLELDLRNNRIKEKGAIAIASALKEETSIRRFFLDANPISTVGALTLLHALQENHSIEEFGLQKLTQMNWKSSLVLDEVYHETIKARKENREVSVIELEQKYLIQLANENGWKYVLQKKQEPIPETQEEKNEKKPKRFTKSPKKKKKKPKKPPVKIELPEERYVLLM